MPFVNGNGGAPNRRPSKKAPWGYDRRMDLLEKVRLLRPAGGFATGTVGTVADVWCEGRCVVEVDGPAGPSFVEIEEAALERVDGPASGA